MFYSLKKRMVTLIELLIAMSLLTILLTALFSTYSSIISSEVVLERKREEGFKKRFLQSRLATVIQSVTNSKEAKLFYTERVPFAKDESLVFYFDNGMDVDPLFANELLTRLFLDNEGSLILATWPKPKEKRIAQGPYRQEVILGGVKSFHLSFFVPSDKTKIIENETVGVKAGDRPIGGDWITSGWQELWNLIPPLVKVSIVLENHEEIEVIFYIPRNDYPLDFTQGVTA